MFHYLDHAATTQVRSEAAQAALEAMTEGWGNPSSRHGLGTRASEQVRKWREETAQVLGCQPGEVYFTSCGTEGNNWAIRTAAELGKRKGKHIITSVVEHSAVVEPCKWLERQGYEVTWLKPDRNGVLSMEELSAALRPDTVLVSLMLVNNELGTVNPIAEVSRRIRESGSPALLHCDAVQGFLKVPFTPGELGVDFLTVSGHKFHAPKGIGVLYVRSGVKLSPMILGGGQENGQRSGTEATAQMAAFATAARLGKETLEEDIAHMSQLKSYAAQVLIQRVPGLVLIGTGTAPHIMPISLPGYKSEVLLRFLSDRGIYVSSGSACHKGKPSRIYGALGLNKKILDGILRVSFSYDSTKEDIDALCAALEEAQKQLFPSLS